MRLATFESYVIAVRAIGAELGLCYPTNAASDLLALGRVMDTPAFKVAFPAATLLLTPMEVAAAKDGMPDHLVPFMREPQATWSDYYAFGTAGSDSPVAVWADHAVVMDWQDFDTFLRWVVALSRQPGPGPAV